MNVPNSLSQLPNASGKTLRSIGHTWLAPLWVFIDWMVGLLRITDVAVFGPVRAMTATGLPSNRYFIDASTATTYLASWLSAGPSLGVIVQVPATGGGSNYWGTIVSGNTAAATAPAALKAQSPALGTTVVDGSATWALLNQFQLQQLAYQASWASVGPGLGLYTTVGINTWKVTTAGGTTAATTAPSALSAVSPALGTTVTDGSVVWTFVPAMHQTKFAIASGALGTVDGVTNVVGDRIYDASAGTTAQRGFFLIQTIGGSGAWWSMIRTSDANTSGDYVNGRVLQVGSEGSTLGSTTWSLTNVLGFILDTTTPAIAAQTSTSGVTLATVQTITGVKTFWPLALKVFNAGKTFATAFTSLATAARTFTLPDVDMTPAQATVATGGTAPAFTATPAAITPTVGATIGWATNVGTISAGGPTCAANALAGGFIDDGTNTCLIISNTACTPTTGTITQKPLTKLPACTGVTVTIVPPVAGAGTVASHTHVQT